MLGKQKKPNALKNGFKKFFNAIFHKKSKQPSNAKDKIPIKSETALVKKSTELSEYAANEEELNEFSTNNSNQSDNREIFLRNHASCPVFLESGKKEKEEIKEKDNIYVQSNF